MLLVQEVFILLQANAAAQPDFIFVHLGRHNEKEGSGLAISCFYYIQTVKETWTFEAPQYWSSSSRLLKGSFRTTTFQCGMSIVEGSDMPVFLFLTGMRFSELSNTIST